MGIWQAVGAFVGEFERWANPQPEAAMVRPRWLTLSGPSGCGKTMLSREVFAFAKQFRVRAFYANASDWADEMRGGCYRNEYMERSDILILDDFGAERVTPLIEDATYRLFNSRLGRWTFLTTNKTFDAIADMDVRLSSRMIRDGNVFHATTAIDFALR